MERPENIYLHTPIETIAGFKINYTHKGAIYMAAHYQHMLQHAAPNIKPFMQECLARLEKCIQYYESQNLPTAQTNRSPDTTGDTKL